MTWTISYAPEEEYVHAVLKGKFTSKDHRAMIDEVVHRDFWRPGMSILFDNRELTFPEPGFAELLAASENHVEFDALIGNGKAANLMQGVVGFGSGRQYQNIVGGQVASNIRIFTDEKEALAWLLSEKP